MSKRDLGLGLTLAILVVWASVAWGQTSREAATVSAQALSRVPIAASSRWRGYDEAPAQVLVRPVRVLEVTGSVTNAQALARSASGQTTTLTYAPGGEPPSLVLDYGKDVAGLANFDVAATSGTTIEATYSETLRNLGDDGAASVALFQAGNPQRTDSFPVTHPGVVVASLIQGGERYERVTLTTPGSVRLKTAGIRFTALRERPSVMQGHFLSSDDLLNRIWYAGTYTLNLNQMTPGTAVVPGAVNQRHLILDGAKRDRLVWSGDHLISDLTDYYVSDPNYARDSDALFLEHPATTAGQLTPAAGSIPEPGPLPGVCSPNPNRDACDTWSASYSMVVMTALYNYYLYTGDLALARRYWEAVVRQMKWDAQQVGSDGLVAVDSVDDSDWNIEKISGTLTYVNAVYVQALQSAAKLAVALGHRGQARAWSAAARSVKKAVNRDLWNRETGVYDASTTERGSVVQDANVTAILAGIPSAARARKIVTVLQHALRNRFGPLNVSSPVPSGYTQDISPYMGSFQVLADFAIGNDAGALSIIRQEWGFMISHDPGGVAWERIQLSGIPVPGGIADSSAHAWSTGPTAALSQYVLGVTPATPGYLHWTVAPEPDALRWAQGVVPTPHGPISVRWQRGGSGTSFKLTVIVPSRQTGVVELPLLGRRRVIAMDGRIVWDGRHATGGARAHAVGGAIAFANLAGQHTLAWTEVA